MGGLMSGVLWGTLVSVVGLAALSLSSPLPPRGGEATVETPQAEDVPLVAEGTLDGDAAEEDATLEEAAGDADSPTSDGDGEGDSVQTPELMPEVTPEDTGDGAEDGAATVPATEIPLPSGSEFNRPPPEPEAALPAPDAAPAATAPQAPTLSGDVSAPSLDTAPAAQPSVAAEGPAQIAAAAGEASGPASPAAAPAPVIASGPSALTQPEASPTPQVSSAFLPQVTEDAAVTSEAPETPETPETDVAAEAPEADVSAEGPETDTEQVAVAAEEPEVVPLQTPVFPSIGDGAGDAAVTPEMPSEVALEGAMETPVEEVSPTLSAPAFPQTSTLPQVAPAIAPPVAPSVAGDAAEADAPAEGDAPDAPDPGDLPAIQAFAAPFDTAEERPLMAVVLIDEPESPIDLSTLTRFTFPVAFAVDPLSPDARARAAAYREAGFEVVILGSMIADGATGADTEVALAAAASTLPEAVAVLDTPEGRIQGDRPVLDALVAALGESGHGLVAFPRGLNAAEQSASRAGVPAATVFRFLDDEDQQATVITRILSRAAFAAAQEGNVIVVGRTRPDTVTALFSWALGGRFEAVALAPLSATLLRGAGE
ncbi:divergent polysaccharide deacetylase family protein [Rhodobacteraceae bacterium N5(2021)]|uniref:Divergent polysaccharide deacetylase family protein n=1 Tax=Gymnodinialimonas phycosphaerae TaxID=2841589 RepID=A0A975YGG9_9RHOB|nr:polysaccharide deacteylase family 2 protein [Gymnodinialimonas phycosphaerae]MBY4891683.1 divergent polysaccharide deacetylase family protein [Gymnodinialimonas phycosphaerae]